MLKHLGETQLAWHLSVSAFFYFWQKEKVLVCCWQCNYFAQDQCWSGDLALRQSAFTTIIKEVFMLTQWRQCT
jgi:hypothetical protein